MPDYLTPEEVARALALRGITDNARTVRKWCTQGHFPNAFTVGAGRWLIPQADIDVCSGPPQRKERKDKGARHNTWKWRKRSKPDLDQ